MKKILFILFAFVGLLKSAPSPITGELYLESDFIYKSVPYNEIPQFRRKVTQMALKLGVTTNAIMVVVALESSWDPHAQNQSTHAVGLIQLMPETVKNMKLNADSVLQLSVISQLPIVERYFEMEITRRKVTPKDAADLYCLIFCPRGLNPKYKGVLYIKNSGDSLRYKRNAKLDFDKNDTISIEDIRNIITQRFPKAFHKPENNTTYPAIEATKSTGVLSRVNTIDSLVKCDIPYLWGGVNTRGFDCSGFVWYVFQDMLKHRTSSKSMFLIMNNIIPQNDIQQLDLVFFKNKEGIVCHVGIMINSTTFAHASTHGVKYSSLSHPYYNSTLTIAGFRRIIP